MTTCAPIEIYAPESAARENPASYPRRRRLPGEARKGEVYPHEQEWAYRVVLIPNEEWHAKYGRKQLRDASDIPPLFDGLTYLNHEEFWVLALDARNKVIATSKIAQGALAACPVSPASFFRAALLFHAVAVVAVHNHPSGDVSPSPEDRELTQQLVAVAKILSIRFLDHVVVGRDPATGAVAFASMHDSGLV